MIRRSLLTLPQSVGLAAGLFCLVITVSASTPVFEGQPAAPAAHWYKGNTHSHSWNTDADVPPDEVARWYREQKYNFLVFTDHDTVTDVAPLNALFAPARLVGSVPGLPYTAFMVLPGEEVTDRYTPHEASGAPADGERDLLLKQIHVTAMNLREPIAPQGGGSPLEALQRDVDAVRAGGGIPIINHPNFTWALTTDDLKRVRNVNLFELYNGHLQTNYLGGGGQPGVEEMWDQVLASGRLLYAVASDDAHQFKLLSNPGTMSLPGRGWVMVRATELSAAAIFAALEHGDFYASTGVDVADYQVTQRSMSVTVASFSRSKYRIQFVGKGGQVLKEVQPETGFRGSVPPATYEFKGDEGYVRARIVESNGKMAWMQPVLVPRR
jgi:hypothetical protein